MEIPMNLINGLAYGKKYRNLQNIYFMGKSMVSMVSGEDFPQETNPVILPIGSMYAIYGNIYHQYTPNVMDPLILSQKEQRNSMNSGELFGLRGAFCSAEPKGPKGWLKKPWVSPKVALWVMVSSNLTNLTVENWNFMGFHSDFMGFHSDFMGFHSDSMGFHSDSMGRLGVISWDSMVKW